VSEIYFEYGSAAAPSASKYASKITVSVLAKQNPLALLTSVDKHHIILAKKLV